MVNQGSLHSVLLQSIVSHLVTLGCSAARLPQSGSACISSLSACETFDRGRKQRKGRLPFVGDVWYCFSCLWPLSREELVHAKFTQMSACLFIVAYLTLLSFNYGILERFLWGAEAVQNKKTFWVHLFAPTCAVKKKGRKKNRMASFFFFRSAFGRVISPKQIMLCWCHLFRGKLFRCKRCPVQSATG